MDDFWRLVSLSLAMFIGCYAAGAIPLALTLSEVRFPDPTFSPMAGLE